MEMGRWGGGGGGLVTFSGTISASSPTSMGPRPALMWLRAKTAELLKENICCACARALKKHLRILSKIPSRQQD